MRRPFRAALQHCAAVRCHQKADRAARRRHCSGQIAAALELLAVLCLSKSSIDGGQGQFAAVLGLLCGQVHLVPPTRRRSTLSFFKSFPAPGASVRVNTHQPTGSYSLTLPEPGTSRPKGDAPWREQPTPAAAAAPLPRGALRRGDPPECPPLGGHNHWQGQRLWPATARTALRGQPLALGKGEG
jgi:hypothetical protein